MADRRIRVQVEADESGDFNSTARGLDAVAREADDADVSLRRMSKGAHTLDAEINKTAYSIKSLRSEFERTGDLDLLKDADKLDRQLGTLRKQFAKLGDEGGKDLGSSLQISMFESIRGLASSPAGIAVGAGLAAAISPVIGAAVGAGVTAGIGGGVLATGIALAARDSRVSDAWGAIADGAKVKFTAAAGPMVQPLVDSATLVGREFDELAPKAERAFATLAPRIGELTTGASEMLDRIFGSNFDRVVDLGGRLIGDLADELPNFGNAIADMLGSLADAGPDIEHFWSEFLVGSQRTIVAVGNITEALAKTYTAMDSFGDHVNNVLDAAASGIDSFVADLDTIGDGVNKNLDQIFGRETPAEDSGPSRSLTMLKQKTQEAGAAAAAAKVDYAGLMSQVSQTAATADTVFGAVVDRLVGTMLGLDQATLGFAESQTRLAESINQNGQALDIHTAKGQANREAILGVVAANQQEFDAMLKSGSSAEEAAAAYNTNTAALEAQLRAAHFTQGEIDGLIGKYRNVPKDVQTQILLNGLDRVVGGLNDVARAIRGIPSRHDIYITQHLSTVGGFSYKSPDRVAELADMQQRHGGFVAAAHGTIVDSPTVLFGERGTGKETYVPWNGISPQRAYELMAPTAANFGMKVDRGGGSSRPVSMGDWRGGGASTVNLSLGSAPTGALERALGEWFLKTLRTDGGFKATIKRAVATR